ncbi:nuclear transport factor 2 family protein [Yinghuangia sp. ASG 101]|uniref:nuclear transport factor 2 family protein n=1 Tax=Yinghuangia sp. ASG 101 TaxID=2896848 RepID=UPI001E3BE317|nr:nuclear transport factor 2 family protein [Yinghuangia sp. ASG 101]UGQ11941.1 nuclear transport factor 2 family protein [Yinghuangia sp. ASG 101]
MRRRRLRGVAALFTPDAVYAYGDRVARGPSELVAFLDDSQGRPEQRGKHLTVNCVVEPDDDHVRAVSDFVFLRHDERGLVPAVAGRYRDRLVRTDGLWLIAERLIERFGA